LAFIREHAEDNVQTLALRASRFPDVEMATAIRQIAARQAARVKLPTWWATEGVYYPNHLPMEQCSSEVTALYKSSLIPEELRQGGMLADLSGGFGVDFACMAKGFAGATYVERQEELCVLAVHNLPLLGISNARVMNMDAVEYLKGMSRQTVIFIDPARRDPKGKKKVAINDCEPNVARLHDLLVEKADRVIVKLSPMLDIAQAMDVLPCVREVHVVAVGGECKELLLVMEQDAHSADARIVCTNLPVAVPEEWPEPFVFTRQEEEEADCPLAERLDAYLYEPDSTILKAGAFRMVALRYGLKKLHPNSHLYTSEKLVTDFPGRCFRVIDSGGFAKHEVKYLQGYGSKMNLTVRNFPSTVADLRKRLKLTDGGDDYLFATTLSNGGKRWVLCKKVASSDSPKGEKAGKLILTTHNS